jgi:hypothetical protein
MKPLDAAKLKRGARYKHHSESDDARGARGKLVKVGL